MIESDMNLFTKKRALKKFPNFFVYRLSYQQTIIYSQNKKEQYSANKLNVTLYMPRQNYST